MCLEGVLGAIRAGVSGWGKGARPLCHPPRGLSGPGGLHRRLRGPRSCTEEDKTSRPAQSQGPYTKPSPLSTHTRVRTHVLLLLRRALTPQPQPTHSACGPGRWRVLGTRGISMKRHNQPGTQLRHRHCLRGEGQGWDPAACKWQSWASPSSSASCLRVPKVCAWPANSQMHARSDHSTRPGRKVMSARGQPEHRAACAPRAHTCIPPCSRLPRTPTDAHAGPTHMQKGAELPPRPSLPGLGGRRKPTLPLLVPKATTPLPAPAISAWADGPPGGDSAAVRPSRNRRALRQGRSALPSQGQLLLSPSAALRRR